MRFSQKMCSLTKTDSTPVSFQYTLSNIKMIIYHFILKLFFNYNEMCGNNCNLEIFIHVYFGGYVSVD